MRFAIAYYKNNIAGKNIVDEFKKLAFAPQIPIIELKKETIFSEDLNEKNYPELRNIDFLVFASTHKSIKQFPSLCLHAPGNWRNADLGGKQGKVCLTSSFALKYLFQNLNKIAEKNHLPEDINITLEVTHHGPLIEIPCCFIEVGSSEKEWNNRELCKIVAETILTLQNYNSKKFNFIPAIGIGGPHYSPSFNKIQLNSEYALSHIIPEYSLPLTPSMLKEAEEKTTEQIKAVLLDWKGCGKSEQRQEIISIIKQAGLNSKRTSEVEK